MKRSSVVLKPICRCMARLDAADMIGLLFRRPLPRRLALVTASGTLLAAVACARSGSADRTIERVYRCDGGISFVVSFRPGRAKVVTRSGVYVMEARKASFGQRYASDDVAFAQDEDRAVLVGAVGGPFRNCAEIANAERKGKR